MEKFPITITSDKEIFHFEIVDYLHHDDQHCKFEAFLHGYPVAGFEPDRDGIIHVCNNDAGINEEILHQLADQIEQHHWHE